VSLAPDDLHRTLASVLEVGTWLASALVTAGLFLSHAAVVLIGTGLFISLPIVRVVVMFAAFTRGRDGWGAAIAGLVSTLVVLGVVLGVADSNRARDQLHPARLRFACARRR